MALLGALALAIAAFVWWRYRQRFPVIEALPSTHRGFGWQPLPTSARGQRGPTDARRQRQLVRNIEQFIADDPTRRLDLPHTVDATARARGCVRMHFLPAAYERAVWFWLDPHFERPLARQVAGELLATLRADGLNAR